ncbi:hypothetical protein WJX73_004609 [Symbiochloris irregularis]|uniref:Uncharacterized protein n=1 Tax=Symbiochloris irregularis TaxID=706552 RepID=A0AAW1PM44_9CHLO
MLVSRWLHTRASGVVRVAIEYWSRSPDCRGRHRHLTALLGLLKAVPLKIDLELMSGDNDHLFNTENSQGFIRLGYNPSAH